MAPAEGLAGFVGGAWAALGLVVAFIAWRLRRATLWAAAAAAGLVAAWVLAAGWPAVGAGLLWAAYLAFTCWLIHRALLALHAGRLQRAELRRTLLQRDAQLQQAQAQLQQAQLLAESADQAKARFLAAASHDLRQPAHALGLYTAALRAGPLAPQQAELAERMQGSLAALDLLFAALLDVSRIDAGAVVPQWDTVALAPLLRRLADEWAPQAEARGLRLALHVSNPLAQTVTDPVLLERVLRNLLANAVKYTTRGGVLLACRQRTDHDGQVHHRIEVWDSGVGIAAVDHERVFEEFYQASTASEALVADAKVDADVGAGACASAGVLTGAASGVVFGAGSGGTSGAASGAASGAGAGQARGLGLGLAIVQRLARLLQLRVQLLSRPGRGTVFMVEGLAPAGVAPLAAAAARLQMRRLAGLLVVVLEEDADLRDAMRRLLQLWDCRVVDGHGAADLLQRLVAKPDAVIAALRLGPGRSGPQALRQLQTTWGAEVPVLWISGEPAPDTLRAQLPPDATVLNKPVSPARLRAWLEQRLPAAPSS